MPTKKLQIIDSLIKQAENADMLDGKTADEFALASDLSNLQSLVGDTSVSIQISNAMSGITSDIQTQLDGKLSTPTQLATEDLDGIKSTGFYWAAYTNSVTNKPDGVNNFGLLVYNIASTYVVQELTTHSGDNVRQYHRFYNNGTGTWSSWVRRKFTDTTYTLSSFGITATANELNYVDGVTSNIQTQLNDKVPTTRTVNGKTLSADITLSANDVGADASGAANTALTNAKSYTDGQIDAMVGDKTVSAQISAAVANKADSDHTHSSYVNQKAFSNVKVDSTTIAADSATGTLTLIAGDNITITPDATNDKITVASIDTKNTAGATDIEDNKIYLIGATSQETNPQTYSRETTYVNADKTLASNGYTLADTKTFFKTGYKKLVSYTFPKETSKTYYVTLKSASGFEEQKFKFQTIGDNTQYTSLVTINARPYMGATIHGQTLKYNGSEIAEIAVYKNATKTSTHDVVLKVKTNSSTTTVLSVISDEDFNLSENCISTTAPTGTKECAYIPTSIDTIFTTGDLCVGGTITGDLKGKATEAEFADSASKVSNKLAITVTGAAAVKYEYDGSNDVEFSVSPAILGVPTVQEVETMVNAKNTVIPATATGASGSTTTCTTAGTQYLVELSSLLADGDYFELYNGGIKCKKTGYILVSGSIYYTAVNDEGSTSHNTAGCYIYQNNTEILANMGHAFGRVAISNTSTKYIGVDSGDVFYIKGRSSYPNAIIDNDNNATFLTIVYTDTAVG